MKACNTFLSWPMGRANLLALIQQYQKSIFCQGYELATVKRLCDFIADNRFCMNRTCRPGHVTGSAFILDRARRQILLTHHKKLNIWVQLGGHADGDFNIRRAALREAREESGFEDLQFLYYGIFDIDIHAIPGNKKEPAHDHYDIRFALQANQQVPIASHESHQVKFISYEKIGEYTSETSILRMVNKARYFLT